MQRAPTGIRRLDNPDDKEKGTCDAQADREGSPVAAKWSGLSGVGPSLECQVDAQKWDTPAIPIIRQVVPLRSQMNDAHAPPEDDASEYQSVHVFKESPF